MPQNDRMPFAAPRLRIYAGRLRVISPREVSSMFDSLDEQMKRDENRESTPGERNDALGAGSPGKRF